MTRTIKAPGPEHAIEIEPTATEVTIALGDVVIAKSKRALTLREDGYPPRHYVPIADIEPGLIQPSEITSYCPYKGDCSYYTVTTPAETVADAGWEYKQPYSAVEQIAGHVAFYADRVRIEIG